MLTKLRTRPIGVRRRPKRPQRLSARVGEDLNALEGLWPTIEASDSCPSAAFSWVRAAKIAFAESEEAQVFTAVAGARTLAATALVAVRRQGIIRLAPPDAELGLPCELAATHTRALDCLAGSLVRSGQPIVFDRMLASSPTVDALRRAARGHALSRLQPASPYLFVPLDESWAEPERHLLKIDRRRLSIKRRRAERLGPVRTQIHSPDLDELPGLLDLVCDLTSGFGWPTSDEAVARRLNQAVFLRQYADAACVDGTLRVCVLRIGDRVAAVQLGIETGNAFWQLQSGEDTRLSRYRPSQMLAQEVLRYAAQADLTSCEFWGPQQPWMQTWTAHRRQCVSLSLYPLSLRGLAAATADAGIAARGGLHSVVSQRYAYAAWCQRILARCTACIL